MGMIRNHLPRPCAYTALLRRSPATHRNLRHRPQEPSMQAFDHRKYRPVNSPVLKNRQWPSRVITQAPIWASVEIR